MLTKATTPKINPSIKINIWPKLYKNMLSLGVAQGCINEALNNNELEVLVV